MTELSVAQLVARVLAEANQPLTAAEIQTQVEQIRPIAGRNPRATIRNAVNNNPLIATLGGRPAHYTWWPHHLADNLFRQPLATSDVSAGSLALTDEVWLALWPDFFGGASRSSGQITLLLADFPPLQTRIEHLVAGQSGWGIPPTPDLADWFRQQQATPEDELVVHVLNAGERRYAVHLVRRAERDETALATCNRRLANAAEAVLRAGRLGMPDSYLIPRLIARDVYHNDPPPDPLTDLLRADLRFVVDKYGVSLAEKLVDVLEADIAVSPDLHAWPRPRGDRRKAHADAARQAWAAYLFDRGMDHLWAGWSLEAEAYYKEALRLDPNHADAWVHLGNRRFEEGWVTEALALYERGQAAAERRTIGDPDRYPHPFWGDVDSRPFMRALHGRGLCLWRLGRTAEAGQILARMLKLNPNDNQGARFLLADLNEGLSWEESVARDEAQRPPGH